MRRMMCPECGNVEEDLGLDKQQCSHCFKIVKLEPYDVWKSLEIKKNKENQDE